jgi:methylglutaconyl-CoA hydratase
MSDVMVRQEGAVRILTLNRPEVRNALSPVLRQELSEALIAAEDDAAVRAVVITGAGDAFCSGLDLSELASLLDRSTAENRADSRALADLFLRMVRFRKPLLAAVNGPAVAGGAGLMTACDVVVAAEGARIGYTEARIGFVAALVAVLLVRQVGEKHARDLLLSARLVPASEAMAMGLVNEVVPADEVMAHTLARAQAMARNAPGSIELTKQLLAGLPGVGLEDGMRWAVEVNALARSTDDMAEGVRAFLEKREPSWRA